jgi:hypothetical protein
MIRGAIETASRSTVSGWLYSQKFNLHGQLLLAFVGDRHVGSGRIEIFRKDLLQAGLGDGYSGFYFAVELRPGETPESMTVRLEECDLALLHPDCLVAVKDKPQAKSSMAGSDAGAAPRSARAANQWRQAQG